MQNKTMNDPMSQLHQYRQWWNGVVVVSTFHNEPVTKPAIEECTDAPMCNTTNILGTINTWGVEGE